MRSKKYVVLAALQRSPNELASHQKKLMKIDDHMGISMSGLTADGRSLVKYVPDCLRLSFLCLSLIHDAASVLPSPHRYMRNEALNHKYVYGTPVQGSRLVSDVADMHQRCTQSYVRRPYGVGLLVASCDQTGPHLYVTEPSGNYYEYYAMAIGSRSQTSRTYLEREFESFSDASLDDLIKHAVKALAASLSGDSELDVKSAAVAVVGIDAPFKQIEGAALQRYLDEITTEQETGAVDAGAMDLETPDL